MSMQKCKLDYMYVNKCQSNCHRWQFVDKNTHILTYQYCIQVENTLHTCTMFQHVVDIFHHSNWTCKRNQPIAGSFCIY